MKKSMFASVKPLAMATAVAAGTSMSMIAVALPGGDTSGAAGVVNESVCHNTVDMTIASGSRSVTTGTGSCQLRTLPPTKGLVLAESTPAGGTVSDSSALVNAGGESYETYVASARQGSLLLTPNRSLAVTRSSSFVSGADGAVSFDLGAAVQPSTGLQSSWLTGTYNIMQRAHSFQVVASGLEYSAYANPNPALGERNFTSSMTVTFNGDGTCSIDDMNNNQSFTLTKDPMLPYFGEMDNGCTVGGGNCGQNDGWNYVAMGNVNTGATGSAVDYYDWNDATNPDGKFGEAVSCTYTTGAGTATVSYTTQMTNSNIPESTPTSWSVTYDVSADLRYLVAAQAGTQGNVSGVTDGIDKGDIAVGVRVGAGDVSGKTYLFNMTALTGAASTPATASYENPAQPLYSEEECISRGSIEFVADGSCNMQSVSSCAGRAKSGYEESADGAADGTIVDSLTVADGADAAPTSCAWTNAGGLVVTVGTTDPDANPITMTYTGDVSDNGEALVLQGEYSVQGASPDVENPPLLPQQKFNMVNFMVAQEFQGSLAGDADADGTSNYDEFVWAADLTPPGGARNDYNADGSSDVLWVNSVTAATQLWSAGLKSATTYPGNIPAGFVYAGSGDFDGDGSADALFFNSGTLSTLVWGGAVKANASYPGKVGAGFAVAATCDVTGDGSADIVWRNATTGATQVWPAASKASATYPGTSGLTLAIEDCGDYNGDGSDDLFFRDNANGSNQIWPSAVKANVTYPGTYLVANVTVRDSGDLDGNGTDDILWFNSSTGATLVWGGGLKSNATYPGTSASVPELIADFTGDGQEDIYFKNVTTGGTSVWNNGVKANTTYPGTQSNLDFDAQE